MKRYAASIFAMLLTGCMAAPRLADSPPATPAVAANGLFVVRSTARTPDDVVRAIEAYAQAKQWPYLGADRVKQGEIVLVKLCIPEVGKRLWPLGPQLSAMLPCGNLGVYRKDGRTEVSLLHPRYLAILYPDPAVEQASTVAEPLLLEMLEAVTK